MDSLEGRTIFMSGGSRGIGLAIAVRAAHDGARVALMAKTAEPHPKLEGTIYTAAEEIEAAGGEALPIVGDIRDAHAVESAVTETVQRFGGVDMVVNNASAINLAPMADLPVKRFDLMQQINSRGTFVVTRACLPHLRRVHPRPRAHALPAARPIRAGCAASAPTRSEDGHDDAHARAGRRRGGTGVGANCLWPRTIIATAAVQNLLGGDEAMARARTPEIMGDAAHAILVRDPRECSGNAFIDDEVLAEAGVSDLSGYSAAGADLALDLFVDGWPEPARRRLDRPPLGRHRRPKLRAGCSRPASRRPWWPTQPTTLRSTASTCRPTPTSSPTGSPA